MSDYETLRSKHAAEFATLTPQFMERINWSAEQLRAERERRLRALISVAKEQSAWHRGRLASIDAETVTEADLVKIPTMTKEDMMANLDGIFADSRLTRDLVENHLASLSDDAYLLDEFHVIASGGSSGTRGVFVYGWQAWAEMFLTLRRFRVRYIQSDREIDPSSPGAAISAGKATHVSYALNRTFPQRENFTTIPATLPLNEIVERLNEINPVTLTGYATSLYALAKEAIAGRLRIRPRMVGPISEPLLPEMRSVMKEAWRCPVLNAYGASEGVAASACGQGRGMHLAEDVAIFELVDAEGNPVPPGVRASKMYITNLFNTVQPLIRYELTDEATLIDEPCACGCAMRRIDDIEGRSDDVFVYGSGVSVHPLVFRSHLGGNRNIAEYQVRQVPRGASIAVRASGEIDASALAGSIEKDLQRAGVRDARVTIEVVDTLDQQQTGKFKRFVPL